MKFLFFTLLIIAAFVLPNHHVTLAEVSELPQDPARCNEEPILRSKCRAGHPRFYYKADTSECVSFSYGGCGANGNIFKSQEDCEKLCKK